MQHIIRSTTSRLLESVTEEQLHYTPAELEQSGYPSFLVERIRLELERNLADSVSLPDSDWADMQADPVQDAWDKFLTAIRAETRVPSSYLKSVTENAVEDLIELMAEPQRMVIETLFRQDKKADIITLQVRRPWIVVNGYLADAVIRFMQRRDLQEITRDKATDIVRQLDQHLAATYTPLKWAQALETWNKLLGDLIPAAMLTRYFQDKGLAGIARKFEQAEEQMVRSRLIEYLSMPDLDWLVDEETTSGTSAASSSGREDHSEENPSKDKADQETIVAESESGAQPTSPHSPAADAITVDSTEDENPQPTLADTIRLADEEDDEMDEGTPPFTLETSDEDTSVDDEEPGLAAILKADEDDEQSDSLLNQFLSEVGADEDETVTDEVDTTIDSGLRLVSNEEYDRDEDLTAQEDVSDNPEIENAPDSTATSNLNTSDRESTGIAKVTASQNKAKELEQEDINSNEFANQSEDDPMRQFPKTDDMDESEPLYSATSDEFSDEANTDESAEEDTDEDDNTPIWQRFLSASDSSEKSEASTDAPARFVSLEALDSDSAEPEEEFEPEGDILSRYAASSEEESEDTVDESVTENRSELLGKYLQPHESILIDEIFGGESKKYEEAIAAIVKHDTWPDAGKYIARQVFAPNQIDMYTGEAVLLMDLVQQFYDEQKS